MERSDTTLTEVLIMRKKILFIFLILLLSQVCFAGRVQKAHKAVIAAKNGASSPVCDPFSMLGDNTVYWTGDYNADCAGDPSDDEKDHAVTTGSATIDGTVSGGTWSNTISEGTGSTGHDGTWTYRIAAKDHYIRWASGLPSTSSDHVRIYFYPTALTAGILWEMADGDSFSGNMLYVECETDGTIVAIYRAHSTSSHTQVYTANQWNYVDVRWDVTGDDFDISINGGEWQHDDDDLVELTGQDEFGPGELRSAYGSWSDQYIYFDDMIIYGEY